jgi:AcrR family transcriptional regulator
MAGEDPTAGEHVPLGRLPSGPHGLPRDLVTANHRERLIVACAQVVPERGYVDTTVADIIKAAAVSRRTFYEHFDDKEDCFLATYDLVVAHLRARIVVAFESETEWTLEVRSALAALLDFLAEEPLLARLMMVEPLAAGRPIVDHHRARLADFALLLRAGRGAAGDEQPPADTEEAVIAGMAGLITMRIVSGNAEQLEELLPELVEAALTPFVGVAKARRVARLQRS